MSSRNIAFAAAGVSGGTATYIEDVFSTYLYTGTGLNVNNTITNGIDLAAEGGLVWTKSRTNSNSHALNTTDLGFSNYLQSQTTAQLSAYGSLVTMTANSNGYTINDTNGSWNESGQNFVSWTFRKQPKFFDVVTYTGNGSLQNINHSLGSTPGMIIIKSTSSASYWTVYHRSTGATQFLTLNNTFQAFTDTSVWNDTEPTSTQFTVGSYSYVNGNGQTYVAYLFAHNAGGFGESGTDNIISCGSYTGTGTANTNINLGFEPQFILTKRADSSGGWFMQDIMRQMSLKNTNYVLAQTADAETQYTYNGICPNATGFTLDIYNNWNAAGATYIYMAIRRPMKVPTDATTVFSPIANADTTGTKQTTGFAVDLQILAFRAATAAKNWMDRLRGVSTTATNSSVNLQSTNTNAELSGTYTRAWDNTGYQTAGAYADNSVVGWNFSRRPGFFDEVCWTGTSADQTLNHNLTVAPELIIYKARGATSNWYVAHSFTNTDYGYLVLNLTAAPGSQSYTAGGPFSGKPTSTQFSVGQFYNTSTMVAYLFATCPGVSKVGSYTGTGATQTVNCGFTGGARFVLIKRTDASGDWYVWDTARGMVSGTDPSLLLNSTAAEVNANSVYTATTGFSLLASPSADVNTSGGSYIFLAIA